MGRRWGVVPLLALAWGCDLLEPSWSCPAFHLEDWGLERGAVELAVSDWGLVVLTPDSTLFVRSPDGPWSDIGPPDRSVAGVGTLPGRILAVVVDGSWRESGRAGILGSEDGGVTWRPHGTLQDVPLRTCCISLTVSRHGPQSLLLHQRLPRIGHYSDDGGATWDAVRLLPEGPGTVRSAMATRSGFVAAGLRGYRGLQSALFEDPGGEEVFRYSVDGGSTVHDAEVRVRDVRDPFLRLWEDTSDSDLLWGYDGRSNLLRSLDGGRTWTPGFRVRADFHVTSFDFFRGEAVLAGHRVGGMPIIGGPPPPVELQRHPGFGGVCRSQTLPDHRGAHAMVRDPDGNLILGTGDGVFRVR
jgi:hypothetical protein